MSQQIAFKIETIKWKLGEHNVNRIIVNLVLQLNDLKEILKVIATFLQKKKLFLYLFLSKWDRVRSLREIYNANH